MDVSEGSVAHHTGIGVKGAEADEIEKQVEDEGAHQWPECICRSRGTMVDDVAEQSASDHHHAVEKQHTPIGECILREIPT